MHLPVNGRNGPLFSPNGRGLPEGRGTDSYPRLSYSD